MILYWAIEKLENNAWHYRNRKKVMENSLRCHWTLKNVQTFRAEPIISVRKPIVVSWHTPYEETNGESALACDVRARETQLWNSYEIKLYWAISYPGCLCFISHLRGLYFMVFAGIFFWSLLPQGQLISIAMTYLCWLLTTLPSTWFALSSCNSQ